MSKADFADKEYRDEFARAFISGSVATQLKVLREARGLTQAQLAVRAGMKQSRISAIENVNYAGWNIKTLQRLAEALDIALVVRFESFGAVLREADSTSPQALVKPSYADDPVFAVPTRTVTESVSRVATPARASVIAMKIGGTSVAATPGFATKVLLTPRHDYRPANTGTARARISHGY